MRYVWLAEVQITTEHFRVWYFYFPSGETVFMEC